MSAPPLPDVVTPIPGQREMDRALRLWEHWAVSEGASSPAVAVAGRGVDRESRIWLDRLTSTGAAKADAIDALFDLLYRGALHEANRRRGSLPATVVADLDDLARQAADDAVAAVLRKLPDFRGASRFTTWAYKFVVFELSSTLRREAWRGRAITIEDASWERLVDTAPVDPVAEVQGRELLAAIHRAVDTRLTTRQREVFVAVTVKGVPIDAIAERHNSSRGAIYKVLHDAREKLRHALDAEGWRLGEAERRGR